MKNLVIISNNGNHSGVNRTWTLVKECETEQQAIDMVNEMTADDSDIEHGLTICKNISLSEVQELKEERNTLINF